MTQNYKSDEWLRQKLDEKCTVQQMAYLCQVSIGTIQDHLRKNKLQPAIEMPNDLRDVDVLQLCGKQRRPIPQDVIRATTPKDNATVAIIGGNGFVGKNLTTYFKHNTNYNVISYSRMDCDAMDRPALQKKLDCIRPEVVINLAAFVGGIGLNRDNPADMIYRNLMISSNVIDACYTVGIRKLVTMGSVCSYPHTPPHIPFVEDDLWHDRPEPTNEPYGVAKKTTGLMLEAYKRQFNFCSTYLIPTNMYGPHDDFSLHGSHVIPAMIRRFITAQRDNTPVVHWGDGTASRDFLFVDDCCEAIKMSIENIDDPTPINVGSGYECTMQELSNRIAGAIDFKGDIVWDKSKPNGQPRRCLDISRATELLGFKPRTSLDIGLDATIKWYLENA